MTVIALLLIMYECIDCFFCGQKYPAYLFEPNDLDEANVNVLPLRREYDQKVGIM